MTETTTQESAPAAEPATGPSKKKESADQTIKAKWGDRLYEINKTRRQRLGGFVPVVRSYLRLYSKLGISPQAAMAALHILDSKWDKSAPWTSTAVLAKRMGKSESQVKKYIAELRKLGMLATYNAKKRQYTFNFDELFTKFAERADQEIAELKKKLEEEADTL